MADFGKGRLGGPVLLPPVALDFQNFTLNAATDAAEYVLQMPAAATVTQVGFRYGARTGTPPVYKISIQGVDASGNPDGTILGGGSPASATFTPPADATWDGTWRTITLDNSIALTRGQAICVVIARDSGTIDASNCASFTMRTRAQPANLGGPYNIQNDAGVRTRNGQRPNIALYSASETFGWPYSAVGTQSIRNDTGAEWAVKFTLPAGWGDTFKLAGVEAYLAFATADTVRVRLYDTDGSTVLQEILFDTDWTVAAATGQAQRIMWTETTLSTLSFGSTYRIGFFGTTSGKGHTIGSVDSNSAQDLAALDSGSAFPGVSSRSGGTGAWTETATRRLLVDLIFDDWTEPAGGGGWPSIGPGLIH